MCCGHRVHTFRHATPSPMFLPSCLTHTACVHVVVVQKAQGHKAELSMCTVLLFQSNVGIWLHKTRNWSAVCVWRCGQRHQQVGYWLGDVTVTVLQYWARLHISCVYMQSWYPLLVVLSAMRQSISYPANCCCRGHTVHAVCESFQLAKDAGFKVSGHMHLSSSVHLLH